MTARQGRVAGLRIERVIAFGGRLLVSGQCAPEADPARVSVCDAGGSKRMLPLPRSAMAVQAAKAGRVGGEGPRAILLAFALADLVGIDFLLGSLRFDVEAADGTVLAGETIRVATMRDAKADPEPFCSLLAEAGAAGLVPAYLSDLARLLLSGSISFDAPYAIDYASQSNLGFFVEGWIEAVRGRRMHFVSADGLSLVTPGEMLFKVRSDVTAHLAGLGRSPLGDDHGFSVSFAPTYADTNGFVVFVLENGAIRPVGQTHVSFSPDRARVLDLIMSSSGSARFPRPEAARSFLLPFHAERPRTPEFDVSVIHDSGDPIRVSVIIPIYKEYRFIFSLILLQKWFPAHYEWIIVSDDPSLHRTLSSLMERRAKFFSNTTTLVLNRFNSGFAGANSVGASVARGRTLLFMNSDIWVDSAEPIESAVAAVERGTFGVVGFRLLYEDGSIQHNGMDFRPHALMNNLLIVDHPGKGAPPRSDDLNTIVDAPAVTGALMLLSKGLYEELGGFDQAYIKGDFEDADLCLRAKARGHRIGLYNTNALFHLERQSIRLMGSDSSRSALVYLNCITFNTRWQKELLAGASAA